jgi:hypothetical protein
LASGGLDHRLQQVNEVAFVFYGFYVVEEFGVVA